MYTNEFWNKVYQEHKDAPWLTDVSANFFINEVKNYIDFSKTNIILDYGCGNGKIGIHFLQEGMPVEFADTSDEQIDKLNEQFEGKVPTYAVSYPKEISNKYDYIICCSVLHHINPDFWETFLNQFYNLLNPNGRLLITGADEEDAILRNYHGNAPMTGAKCWPINSLEKIIDSKQFKTLNNYKKQIKLELFNQKRTFRMIFLEKV